MKLPVNQEAFLFARSIILHFNKNNKMGRGDKKTKKGKIFKGSFGKSRPANPKKIAGTLPAAKKEE